MKRKSTYLLNSNRGSCIYTSVSILFPGKITLKKLTVHHGCCFLSREIVKALVSFWPKMAKKRFSVISITLTCTIQTKKKDSKFKEIYWYILISIMSIFIKNHSVWISFLFLRWYSGVVLYNWDKVLITNHYFRHCSYNCKFLTTPLLIQNGLMLSLFVVILITSREKLYLQFLNY